VSDTLGPFHQASITTQTPGLTHKAGSMSASAALADGVGVTKQPSSDQPSLPLSADTQMLSGVCWYFSFQQEFAGF
jgi:hypothetical protein